MAGCSRSFPILSRLQNRIFAQPIFPHRFFMCLLVLWSSVFFSSLSSAALQLPGSLTSDDRKEALRIVGFGTATKSLTDPYPLGGYHGLEVGLSLETIPTQDLGRLGNRLVHPQSDVTIPKITIGKGLYSGLDFFLHFMPYNQRNEMSQYGGSLRWGFYEGSSLPISANLVAHINTGNFNNQVTTRTFGLNVTAGLNVNQLALYVGFGALQAIGGFVGGAAGVTNTGRYEVESASAFHTLIGTSLRFQKFFAVVELDRYTQSVLSAKLGFRF